MEIAAKKTSATLMPERMGLAEDKRHDWIIDIQLNVTLDDVLEPSYWAHVAAQMDPLDHVEVRAEDGSWIAYLIVSFCERNYAKMVVDRVVKLETSKAAPVASIKHKVEWKGPVNKFAVIRVSDSQMIKFGFRTKDLAYAALQDHEKAL